jgi:WD40 repeat protein
MNGPRPADLPESPYPGIDPFGYGDRHVFFAREREARHLFRAIAMYRGVLLYSDSGMGKSSLINAGLIPMALAEGYGPERIRVQPRPGEEFIVERVPLDGQDGRHCLPSIFVPEGPERAVLSPGEFLAVLKRRAAAHPLLIFDQFEEWVTLFEDAAAADALAAAHASQQAVAQAIQHLLVDSPLPVKVLLALREDYLAKLSPLFERCPNLTDQYLRLGPLRGPDIHRVIREPFEKWTGRYRPEIGEALAARVVRQFEGRSGTADIRLTELQIVCRSLFEAGRRGQDMDGLFRARGVQGLLEGYLESQLESFDTHHREAALALLSRMVTSLGTRKVVAEDDLVGRVAEGEEIPRPLLEETLGQLERRTRIVRRDRRRDVYYYEIASEFLIPWIGERRRERDTLARQRALERAQQQLRQEKDRAAELEAARDQARSSAEEARRKASQARRRARAAFALAGVAAVVAVLAVWLHFGSASRALAAAALNKLDLDPELGLRLALQAVSIQETREAVEVLEQAVRESRVRHTLSPNLKDLAGLSVSGDGRRVATRSNSAIEIWDASRSRSMRVTEDGDAAAIALSPPGTRLAVARRDGQVTVWDVPRNASSPAARVALAERVEGIHSMAFSPDGELLATADGNGAVKLWEASSGRLSHAVDGGPRPGPSERRRIVAIGFSPAAVERAANLHLASVTAWATGDEVAIWDVARRAPVASIPLEPGERASAVAVGPHGRRVAVALGPTAYLIEVTSRHRTPLRGHVDDVRAIAFSAESERVATASADKTVRVWNASSGAELPSLRGRHSAPLVTVGFGPGGALITASLDGSVRAWDEAVTRHATRARAVALSADEKFLAAAGDDGTLRVWGMKSPAPAREFPGGPTGPVLGIALDTERDHLRAAAAVHGPDARVVVRLRDMAGDSAEQRFTTPRQVRAAALSPEGTHLAVLEVDPPPLRPGGLPAPHSGLPDLRAKVWRIPGGEEAGAPVVWGNTQFLALSSGGRRLAAGRNVLDATSSRPEKVEIEVFDLPSGRRAGRITRREAITRLALSPDGRRVAAAGDGRNIRVWSVESGEELLLERSVHSDEIGVIAFSRDGRRLATGATDHTMKVWDLSPVHTIFGWDLSPAYEIFRWQRPHRLVSITRHQGPIDAVDFGTSDGQVATCSLESIAVRPLGLSDLTKLAQGRVTRPLSGWECNEYLGWMRHWLAARAWVMGEERNVCASPD